MGATRWAIGDGYIPAWSHGPAPEMESHDALCFLNTSDDEAHLRLVVFFSDRDPAGPFSITVPARRTKHVRFNNLDDPEPIPRGKEFACMVESDVPVIVQQTRLDSRQAENALFSTIAWAAE